MRNITDDLGRVVSLKQPPQRIISLCPSITETLFALGAADRIVGVTRYCLHPALEVEQKKAVGGTKQLRRDDIRSLEPDLIIAEKEENTPEDVYALAAHYPVFVTDVVDYDSACKMIHSLGELCELQAPAAQLTAEIHARFATLPRLKKPLRIAYMIWRKPYMCVAAGTYIDTMLARCGLENAFRRHPSGSRYPQVDTEQLQAAKLDAVLLSSEPFPFTRQHIDEFAQLLPGVAIRLVDGEAFSWYGARMRYAAGYLRNLITELETQRQCPPNPNKP